MGAISIQPSQMIIPAPMAMNPAMTRPASTMTNPGMMNPAMMNSPFLPTAANTWGLSGLYGGTMGSGYGSAGQYGGYGSGGQYGGGYGQGSAAMSTGGQQPVMSTPPRGLDWPLGVRVMADTDQIRQEIESSVRTAYSQAAQGKANPDTVKRAIHAIDKLRDRIVREGTHGVVAEATIADAKEFLNNLKESLGAL
jgi:hypothetical protein